MCVSFLFQRSASSTLQALLGTLLLNLPGSRGGASVFYPKDLQRVERERLTLAFFGLNFPLYSELMTRPSP